ncbi:t-SNARE [Lipomyces doorenjongii]|uniref:t-SNARE n=1 Tax=Lipomyces doorenjongii TaxID=383834 RepID=UPI0034CE0749
MFRDRTNLYYSYRQSYARHPFTTSTPGYVYASSVVATHGTPPPGSSRDEDRNPLLSDAGNSGDVGDDVAIEMDILPPSWTDVSDEVNQILDMIKQKSDRLDKLHQEHVLPGFDDRSKQESVIEHLTAEITEHFHECQRLIKSLETILQQSSPTSTQINMSRNMQISLATKVQEVSTQFRKKQSTYLKTLRGNRAASLPLVTTTTYPEDDLDVSFSQSQIQQSARVAESSNDTVIRQREAEITQIAQGIIELADIFKELQTMVIDQGTLLDRIDYNIENMKVHVKAADTELRQAAHYQRRTQKCKIIIFLSLLVFLLMVVIYFKFRRRSYSPPPPPPPPQPQDSTPDVHPAEHIPRDQASTIRIRNRGLL